MNLYLMGFAAGSSLVLGVGCILFLYSEYDDQDNFSPKISRHDAKYYRKNGRGNKK